MFYNLYTRKRKITIRNKKFKVNKGLKYLKLDKSRVKGFIRQFIINYFQGKRSCTK